MPGASTLFIQPAEMQERFTAILTGLGFTSERASACASVFTANSVDGVYTHGVNRFPRFVRYIQSGHVVPHAIPTLKHKFGGLEQWDGNLGPGPLNAIAATDTVMQLAKQHGIGCVTLANTNHWMRGGSYGWQAAKAGYVLIAFTNTTAIMPAWGALDARLGNNPLVIALPFQDEAIVLDMAMSQFSFGAMEQAALKGDLLPVAGGYDKAGNITSDPSAVLSTKRPLPVGYWKGAGLALLLDLLSAILSGGLSTNEIASLSAEHSVSQVFIAIDLTKLGNHSLIATTIEQIIEDYQESMPADGDGAVSYPGERVLKTRAHNTAKGIPVLATVWEEIAAL